MLLWVSRAVSDDEPAVNATARTSRLPDGGLAREVAMAPATTVGLREMMTRPPAARPPMPARGTRTPCQASSPSPCTCTGQAASLDVRASACCTWSSSFSAGRAASGGSGQSSSSRRGRCSVPRVTRQRRAGVEDVDGRWTMPTIERIPITEGNTRAEATVSPRMISHAGLVIFSAAMKAAGGRARAVDQGEHLHAEQHVEGDRRHQRLEQVDLHALQHVRTGGCRRSTAGSGRVVSAAPSSFVA